ncbi:IPT/TIG domain-containing protein [Mucilaginibacter sp.]|uniref:IPT/TIG domain-containing protein n=1 Tax=Mucilaginibacter sp. TaxID=1882438 RepID=UPI0026127F7B|nr:IPT/TIG domain-containing protein [Mucilaginibacter sp.]
MKKKSRSPEAVNLNRIIAIAALTGLFTDMAMLKLKDIFETIIKPNADTTVKPGQVMEIDIMNIKPGKINVNQPNEITIPGKNLDAGKLIIKINDKEITGAAVTSTQIKFTYQIADEDKSKTEFKLVITDKDGKELTNLKMSV